jgi:prolyl-tRNA editing enzyme YbaK/EbsC (Cys-tRNA(Pro) deacylase)
LIDNSLLHHDVVWIGAGTPSHVAGLAPADLQKLAKARGVDDLGGG